ncbi:MAG TPA: DUF4245 family protein [Microbacteriaceae bacterium]|nr:DUF4245 family protein [Microbacteriaceae bacterium]
MAARTPRVVAELGRPETSQETADRKAESSRLYRVRKTPSNLVWALLVSLGVVLVMVMITPRGDGAPREDIDIAAAAAEVASSYDVTPIVPSIPVDWGVNQAALTSSSDGIASWNVSLVPAEGFIRLSQGFDADTAWTARTLDGSPPRDTVTIEGVEWTVYINQDPAAFGNVAYALSTTAGNDQIVVYGSSGVSLIELVASSIAPQVREIRDAA